MPVALVCLLLTVAWPGVAHAHGGARLDTPTALAAGGLMASAWLYARAVQCGAGLGRGHVAAFAAGWGCVLLAVLSPLDTAAAEDFSLHMAQHQLLMIVAPPLLILGRPFAALGATLPPSALRVLALPLRTPPAAAWGLHAAALWAWHVPLLFDAALTADSVHALQHASFFGTALLFWWAVLRRVRSGMAVLYVLTTLIHAGALAALLTFAPAPLYAGTALVEQQLGGLLMWVPAGYALLLAGLIAFHRLLEAHA